MVQNHIRMHVFRGVKNGRLVQTGNALASQQSIFRENFRPSSAAEEVSIVCGTNKHMKSEMLSNKQTDRHTDQVL